MKKTLLMLLIGSVLSLTSLYAIDGEALAKKLSIDPNKYDFLLWEKKHDKNRNPFKKLANEEEKKALLDYIYSVTNKGEAAGM